MAPARHVWPLAGWLVSASMTFIAVRFGAGEPLGLDLGSLVLTLPGYWTARDVLQRRGSGVWSQLAAASIAVAIVQILVEIVLAAFGVVPSDPHAFAAVLATLVAWSARNFGRAWQALALVGVLLFSAGSARLLSPATDGGYLVVQITAGEQFGADTVREIEWARQVYGIIERSGLCPSAGTWRRGVGTVHLQIPLKEEQPCLSAVDGAAAALGGDVEVLETPRR